MVRATMHEIVVGNTRLRVERDCTTGEHSYFVNDQPRDVNAYLAVTQAHLNHGTERCGLGAGIVGALQSLLWFCLTPTSCRAATWHGVEMTWTTRWCGRWTSAGRHDGSAADEWHRLQTSSGCGARIATSRAITRLRLIASAHSTDADQHGLLRRLNGGRPCLNCSSTTNLVSRRSGGVSAQATHRVLPPSLPIPTLTPRPTVKCDPHQHVRFHVPGIRRAEALKKGQCATLDERA